MLWGSMQSGAHLRHVAMQALLYRCFGFASGGLGAAGYDVTTLETEIYPICVGQALWPFAVEII